MQSDTVPRYEVIQHDLAQHIAADNERFATLDRRLERIETDVRSLLEWRWKLVGALGVIIFVATVLAERLK